MSERRINQMIRVPEVRLIGSDGEQIGIVPASDALARSQAEGFDLVEISPTARPPVCKIMDYGKFKFEEEKKLKDARKRQKVIHIKEVKFRPKIFDHDFEFKVKNTQRFLERGDKVKVTIRFRGRELAHPELGYEVVDRIRKSLDNEVSYLEEKRAAFEGRNIIMVLAPGKKTVGGKKSDDAAPGADAVAENGNTPAKE
jgi:translation initiation factor IF-3